MNTSSVRQTPDAATLPDKLEYEFEVASDVDPLELVGNAHLALHHHMAPADGSFLPDDDDE